ncbi:MAG: MATE family efflux transporter [Ruminococcaceae bacterium]|nr:MATE family efflux transporter [Oscillospiraceae bacterium]
MKGDLTVGDPGRVVRRFSFPLLLSVAFQQIYSISDSIIVGKFAQNGEAALAAVGASFAITMIFNAVAIGANSGCSVVISRLFGSRRFESMKTAASTAVISAVVISLAMSLAGVLLADELLAFLKTPENIAKDSAEYLSIYAMGFVFLFLYNIGNGIFTALGDSLTPLVFLICSSAVNIILDFVFVCFCHWDVAGVAFATFIAQGLAGIVSMITVFFRVKRIKSAKYKAFSFRMFKTLSEYAVPGILQQSFVSVGNLFVQSLVNSFGSAVVAGYSAAVKLNTFCVSTMSTLGGALSSFTAQNIGAGRPDRVISGMKGALKLAVALSAAFSLVYFFMPDTMISLFMSSDDMSNAALRAGREYLQIVAPFYAVVAVKLLGDGALRGGGAMPCFMATTFTDLLLRVALSFVLCGLFPALEYRAIWISWPIGWIVSMVLSMAFYLSGAWKRGKMV